jgi:hypothetical protein
MPPSQIISLPGSNAVTFNGKARLGLASDHNLMRPLGRISPSSFRIPKPPFCSLALSVSTDQIRSGDADIDFSTAKCMVDALTEAGLPIIVLRGREGGIELGFNYRTRLTGLAADEAEALAVLLYQKSPALDQLEMRAAASRAVAKVVESLPDLVRAHVESARRRIVIGNAPELDSDDRLPTVANAIRNRQLIYVNAQTREARLMHPAALELKRDGWIIHDARRGEAQVALSNAGNINISSKQY